MPVGPATTRPTATRIAVSRVRRMTVRRVAMAPVEGGGDSAASRDEPTPSGGGRHPEPPPDLAARLPLRFAAVDLGRVRIGLFALADPDVLLDALTQEEFDRSDGRMPYWAVLWPSALALAKVVLAGASPAGRRVLDLGCGLGL